GFTIHLFTGFFFIITTALYKLNPKYAENVNKTIVSEKCSLENKIRFHSISDDQLKENCPPPSQSPTGVPIPSLQNRLPAFVESTPNCSYAPSTSKRRKTMTPFELNVDLFKAPEINFNDSYTSPLKAANSILKS
uniref:Uncharacterized protein n=1 Tax=Romanomermis culicivorax TaxID=13658 RepID=A0A915KA67_ROMCU